MLKKEEDEEKLKEYKKLLEGLESLFIEFQNINNRTIEKKSVKKISSKKDTKINLNNNEFYKSLLESEQHSGKLTLLDDGRGLGISTYIDIGTLNALPKAIQLPGFKFFN